MPPEELDLGDYYFLYPFIVLVLTSVVFITSLVFVELKYLLRITIFSFVIFSILLFPTTIRIVLNKSNYKGTKKYIIIAIRFFIWLLLASFIGLIVFAVLFYILAALFTGGYKIGLPHLPF